MVNRMAAQGAPSGRWANRGDSVMVSQSGNAEVVERSVSTISTDVSKGQQSGSKGLGLPPPPRIPAPRSRADPTPGQSAEDILSSFCSTACSLNVGPVSRHSVSTPYNQSSSLSPPQPHVLSTKRPPPPIPSYTQVTPSSLIPRTPHSYHTTATLQRHGHHFRGRNLGTLPPRVTCTSSSCASGAPGKACSAARVSLCRCHCAGVIVQE